MKKKRVRQNVKRFIILAFLVGILILGIITVQTPQTLFSKAATRAKITATPSPKSIYRYRPKSRRLTPTRPIPTRILTPTINPENLTLQVLAVEKNGEYIGDAHIDFYDGSVKKYYGFFYAFAGGETSQCGTENLKKYKSAPIGKQIFITELIPTFYLKSERTNNGVILYFLYQQKRFDLFTFPKDANHIVVGIDNTRIPDVTYIACLED